MKWFLFALLSIWLFSQSIKRQKLHLSLCLLLLAWIVIHMLRENGLDSSNIAFLFFLTEKIIIFAFSVVVYRAYLESGE